MGGVRNRLHASGIDELAIPFAAGAALLLASLANFLTHNSYPYLRPEIGLIVAGLLVFSALMAAWYKPQKQWGRSFLEGMLAALFADLNTDSGLVIFASGLGVAAITYWRRMSLLGPMAILGLVVLLTTLAGIGGRPSWINTVKSDAPGRSDGKPAIVHLILDEHIGLEGLAHEGPDGLKLRDELRTAYQLSGFALYGGAYSEHYHSANSIPYMLNYGRGLGQMIERRGVETGPTAHLRSLVDRGYRLTVLQSDYADVCTHARFHECITYDSSSLRPTLAAPLSPGERAELITYKFLKLSHLFHGGSNAWMFARAALRRTGISLPRYDPGRGHSSSVGSFEAMDLLLERLKHARPGSAYFAHLLLPHHPYVVTRDCRYARRPWQGLGTGASMEIKRAAYYEQLRCTQRKVDAVLDALSHSRARSNHILIIHGDHGSRMAMRMNPFNQGSGQFDDADMIAAFSTLFAVRTAVPASVYRAERAPVSELLREFAESGFRVLPSPSARQSHSVFLADSEWKPTRRVPLPASWTKGLDRPVPAQ